MSSKKSQQKGLWLPIALGIILGALFIRYASSSDWWQRTFDRGQGFRTVNTGVSVQVAESSPAPPPTLLPANPNPPAQPVNPPSPPAASPPDRMW